MASAPAPAGLRAQPPPRRPPPARPRPARAARGRREPSETWWTAEQEEAPAARAPTIISAAPQVRGGSKRPGGPGFRPLRTPRPFGSAPWFLTLSGSPATSRTPTDLGYQDPPHLPLGTPVPKIPLGFAPAPWPCRGSWPPLAPAAFRTLTPTPFRIFPTLGDSQRTSGPLVPEPRSRCLQGPRDRPRFSQPPHYPLGRGGPACHLPLASPIPGPPSPPHSGLLPAPLCHLRAGSVPVWLPLHAGLTPGF